ncbi:MAG: tRNA (adenosine(37)-N6)-threonylcarbamoyltransferase complex dimerization subunit type 1 TsaB, partial [bacterium]
YFEESKRNHSARLMPFIDEILKKHDLDYGQIDRLAVSTGPGSFTGIRLGVTAAKSLALACEARLVAATNLRLQVEYVRNCSAVVESVIDARRGELYRQKFELEAGEVKKINEPHLITPGDLKAEVGVEEVMMVYRNRSWQPVPDDWPENVRFYSPVLSRSLAAPLAKLAGERFESGRDVDPDRVKPLYIRRSDAQRSRE